MTKGILGRKVGMTQVFTESGELIAVTAVEAAPDSIQAESALAYMPVCLPSHTLSLSPICKHCKLASLLQTRKCELPKRCTVHL